jgi:hypothetical protein
MRLVLLAGWPALAGLTLGCGGDAMSAPLEPRLGTLLVPLEAVGDSGATYELVGGVLSLSGSERLTLELNGQSAETRLLAGPYSVTLLDGWELLRSLRGERNPVDAELRSSNPTRVQIEEGASTSLSLRFRVDGDDIRLGDVPPGTQVGADDGATNTPGDPSGLDNDDGPISLDDPDDATPDDGAPADDADADDADDDAPAAVCADADASCFDDIVERATAASELPLCIRANQLQTALGLVSVCGDSVCASGVAGCPLQADASGTTAELAPDGRLTIDAIAELNPLSVPVLIPIPIFGAITCPVGISGAVLATAEAEPDTDPEGSVDGFSLTGLGTSLDEVALAVQSGNALCAALAPVLDDMRASLEPQVAAALADALDDNLDEITTRLACARCEGACSIACVDR